MRCDGQRGPKVYFHCLHFQEGARLAERTEMDQVVSVAEGHLSSRKDLTRISQLPVFPNRTEARGEDQIL